MKTWKKVLIGVGAVLVLGIIVAVTVYQSQKNVVTVQTGKAQKQSLSSIVSASGEIKPKTYVNIGANAFGKIVKLQVKEGDRVKKGQLLAQLENVQSSADVNATKASLQAAETDFVAAEAALQTSKADLNRAQADADHARLDWERAEGLYKDALIAKQEYDAKKATWESAEAGLAQALARVEQAKAQRARIEDFILRLKSTGGSDGEPSGMSEEFLMQFEADMDDDLNTPKALATLFAFVKRMNTLIDSNSVGREEASKAIGALKRIDYVLGIMDFGEEQLPPRLAELLARRDEARKKKDFSESDRLRKELLAEGILVEDTPTGSRWKRVTGG